MGKRNFDYMKELSSLRRLHALCNEAEVWQLADPDKSALAGRKALEYVVRVGEFVNSLHGAIEKGAFRVVKGGAESRPYVLDENAISIAKAAEDRNIS